MLGSYLQYQMFHRLSMYELHCTMTALQEFEQYIISLNVNSIDIVMLDSATRPFFKVLRCICERNSIKVKFHLFKSLQSYKYSDYRQEYQEFIDNQSLGIKSRIESSTIILFDEQINYGRQLFKAYNSLLAVGVETLPFVLYCVVSEDKTQPFMLSADCSVSRTRMQGRNYYFNPSYPNSLFQRGIEQEAVRVGAISDYGKTWNVVSKFFYKDYGGIFSKSFENGKVKVEGGGSLTLLMNFYFDIYQSL